MEKLGKGGNITLSPEDKGERYLTSSVLDSTMTARVKNRHKERLMGFLNRMGFWVSAVVLVDKYGNQIDHNEQLERLDLIHYELEKLNKTLEEVFK